MSARTSSILAITFAIGVVLITAPTAPAGNCDVAKVRCSRQLLTCLLAVHQRAAREHEPVEQVSIDKCVERFAGTEDVTACIERVENRQDPARPDTICTRETDGSPAGVIATRAREFAAELNAHLHEVFEANARLIAGPTMQDVHNLGTPNEYQDEVECWLFNRGDETKRVTVGLVTRDLVVREQVIELIPGGFEIVNWGALRGNACRFTFPQPASDLVASLRLRDPMTGSKHRTVPAPLPQAGLLTTDPLVSSRWSASCGVVNPGWHTATTTVTARDAATGSVVETRTFTLPPGAWDGTFAPHDTEFFCEAIGTDPVVLLAEANDYDNVSATNTQRVSIGR